MTLSSMTGFARTEGSSGASRWAWEVRSVNGRGLDVRLRLPPGWDRIDQPGRAIVQRLIGRGNVSATLTIASTTTASALRINEAALAAAVEIAEKVHAALGGVPATVDGILALPGIVEREDEAAEGASEALAAAVVAGFEAAVDSMLAARRAEGAALGEILGRHLDEIGSLTAAAAAIAARTPEAVRARLAEQVRRIVEASPGLDPVRLHQEAALVAARADVAEELDRLAAHVAQGRGMLAGGGAIGRKLDFLAQELGREANTLCSKAADLELTRLGIDLKLAVEKLREQVQNLE